MANISDLPQPKAAIEVLEITLNELIVIGDLMIKELDLARQKLYIAGIPHERLV